MAMCIFSIILLTHMHFRDSRVESLVREEEQRAAEHDARVVARLQRRDQHGLAAHGMWVLFHLQRHVTTDRLAFFYSDNIKCFQFFKNLFITDAENGLLK